MNNKSQVYINLTGLAFLSFVFAVVFMVGHTREMVDIITSYIQFNQKSYLNLSNLAYCLVGVLHSLLPVSLLYPHKNIFAKKDMLKLTCYLTSAMYILANLWVFEWLILNIVKVGWSYDVAQFLKVQNMMFNHMQWISRGAETIFYNQIAAVAWFLMGYYFDRNRKTTCRLMLVQMVITFLMPLAAYFVTYGKGAPDWWMKKTIPLVCSDIVLFLGLFYVSRNRETWSKYVSPLRKSKHSHHRHHHHHHHSSSKTANVAAATEEKVN